MNASTSLADSRDDFLGTATDNRISLADPDRWEGLQDSDAEGPDDTGRRGQSTVTPQPLQQQQQPMVAASGDAENEDYRMLLTHRQSNPPQQQQQPPQPISSSRARDSSEEQFMEHLGSRLVRDGGGRWVAGDDEDDDDGEATPKAAVESPSPPPPKPQQAVALAPVRASNDAVGHFSVRRGGNQLADLLPPQQQQLGQGSQQPPPAPATAEAATAEVGAMPAVPKEVYVGYLKLDSGHVVGPFRWSVDSVETPANLEEGLAAEQRRPGLGGGSGGGGLFSVLIDSQTLAGGGSSRQRVITRSGRLAFLDASAGNRELAQQPGRGHQSARDSATIQRSLEALTSGLAALATTSRTGSTDRTSGARAPQQVADQRLTRLLSDALAANGASLMIASTDSPDSPATSQRRSLAAPAATKQFAEAAVRARDASNSSSNTAVKEQQQQQEEQKQLERLVQSLRQEVESLKAQNGSLMERLNEATSSTAAASAAASEAAAPASPDKSQNRPVSKSSYQSLYEMLQEYMQENESLRHENLDLVKYQGEYRKEQDLLARENRRLAARLDRVQRQQQQQQGPKPLYVVSNPDSRASTKQQQQGVGSVASSDHLVDADALLPPIAMTEAALPRRAAFPTPPTSVPTPATTTTVAAAGAPSRELLQLQLIQHQMRQQQLELQIQQQQQAAAYYNSRMPVGPSYNSHQGQPMQQQPPPPPGRLQKQQQNQHHTVAAPESPLYVPKPGEKTYRSRFQQHATTAVRDPHRHPEVNAHAVQDVNKLNESLKSELRQLDGAIQQHQRVNALQSDIRRNEGRKVLKTF